LFGDFDDDENGGVDYDNNDNNECDFDNDDDDDGGDQMIVAMLMMLTMVTMTNGVKYFAFRKENLLAIHSWTC